MDTIAATLEEAKRLQSEVVFAVERETRLNVAGDALSRAAKSLEHTIAEVGGETERVQRKQRDDAELRSKQLASHRTTNAALAAQCSEAQTRKTALLAHRQSILRESNAALRQFGNERELIRQFISQSEHRISSLQTTLREQRPIIRETSQEKQILAQHLETSRKELIGAVHHKDNTENDLNRIEEGRARGLQNLREDIKAKLSALSECTPELEEMRALLLKISSPNPELNTVLPLQDPIRSLHKTATILSASISSVDLLMTEDLIANYPISLPLHNTPTEANVETVLKACFDVSDAMNLLHDAIKEQTRKAAKRRDAAELLQQRLDAERMECTLAEAEAVQIGDKIEDAGRRKMHYKALGNEIATRVAYDDAGLGMPGSVFAERKALMRSVEFVQKQRAEKEAAIKSAEQLRQERDVLEEEVVRLASQRTANIRELKALRQSHTRPAEVLHVQPSQRRRPTLVSRGV